MSFYESVSYYFMNHTCYFKKFMRLIFEITQLWVEVFFLILPNIGKSLYIKCDCTSLFIECDSTSLYLLYMYMEMCKWLLK
jgi:hypothetical protein